MPAKSVAVTRSAGLTPEQEELYLATLEDTEDRQLALEAIGVTLRTLNRHAARSPSFRGQQGLAMESARLRRRALVKARVMDVVLRGAPEVQTFKGQVVHEYARDEEGQPIIDPVLDSKGRPVVQVTSDGREVPVTRPRLALDSQGNPIPVVVRKYAEKTTLRVAESLGIFLVPDDPEGDRPSADVMLRDETGKRLALSEVLKARFEAAGARVVQVEPEDPGAEPPTP